MKRFAKRLKETATWLYCWLCDRGISTAGIFAFLLAAAIAIILPKGEPCTCEEQLDPEWVATLQHQRETDYEAFLQTRGTAMLCAAQWLQLLDHLEKTNPIIQTHKNSIR
ncbi:MAG TPA: hypothetical protein VNQ55_05790 [Parapedobacter sp.]|nr:hypothetical protein [Parapedobacter sp.]